MASDDQILALIYDCVRELNRQLPADGRVAEAPETVLTGAGGALDSLSIITLLVDVEQAVSARLGCDVALIDDPELWSEDGAFRTLGSLAASIASRCG